MTLKVSFISKENGDLKETQEYEEKQPNSKLSQVVISVRACEKWTTLVYIQK